MFRFTIRDVLWLTVVVGLGCAWWMDHLYEQAAFDALAKHVRWHKAVGGPFEITPVTLGSEPSAVPKP